MTVHCFLDGKPMSHNVVVVLDRKSTAQVVLHFSRRYEVVVLLNLP